jgi:hypothetical protein
MKVRELLDALANVDLEAEIVLQRDSEGNGFSPLCGVDTDAVYKPDSTWSGQVYCCSWSAEEACMTDEEWEGLKDKPRCVVLWPVN